MKWSVGSLAVLCLVVSLGWLVARYGFGGTEVLLRYMRGEKVVVTPQRFELGLIKAGETIVKETLFHNNSSDTIRILGANTQCSCVLAEDLPATVRPGESYTFHIRVNPEVNKKIDETIVLFTDHPSKPRLSIGVSGVTK